MLALHLRSINGSLCVINGTGCYQLLSSWFLDFVSVSQLPLSVSEAAFFRPQFHVLGLLSTLIIAPFVEPELAVTTIA